MIADSPDAVNLKPGSERQQITIDDHERCNNLRQRRIGRGERIRTSTESTIFLRINDLALSSQPASPA
jgi:hypothetical protein